MRKILPISIFVLALVLIPVVTSAVLCGVKDENGNTIEVENNLNLCYPSFGQNSLSLDMSLRGIIAWAYYLFVGVSGIAAFIMLVVAGTQWMTSAGNPGNIGKAKDRIKQTVYGIALVLGSFILLQIVNPVFVSTVGEPGGLQQVTISPLGPLKNLEGNTVGFWRPGDAEAAPSDEILVYLCEDPKCEGTETEGRALSIYPDKPPPKNKSFSCVKNRGENGEPFEQGVLLGVPNLNDCSEERWNDKTISVTQNGSPLVDILLFDDIDYKGPAICASYFPDLKFYMAREGDRWDKNPSSLKILEEGVCETPYVTFTAPYVSNIYNREDSPAALLFTDKRYEDLSKEILLEDPMGYVYPDAPVTIYDTIESMFIRNPSYAVLVKNRSGEVLECISASKINRRTAREVVTFELTSSCEGY